jgi:hypothetical protein
MGRAFEKQQDCFHFSGFVYVPSDLCVCIVWYIPSCVLALSVGIDLRSGTLQFGPAQILCENEGRF